MSCGLKIPSLKLCNVSSLFSADLPSGDKFLILAAAITGPGIPIPPYRAVSKIGSPVSYISVKSWAPIAVPKTPKPLSVAFPYFPVAKSSPKLSNPGIKLVYKALCFGFNPSFLSLAACSILSVVFVASLNSSTIIVKGLACVFIMIPFSLAIFKMFSLDTSEKSSKYFTLFLISFNVLPYFIKGTSTLGFLFLNCKAFLL